jgi:hypothetical protein
VLAAWALIGGSWRNAEGRFAATVCLPLAGALAGVVLSAAARSPYRRTAVWFSIALVGQAASLQLIDAGNLLRYQHYPPIGTLVRTDPWPLAIVALQGVLVAFAWARWGFKSLSGRISLPRWRIAAALILSLITAATVSPSVMRYLSELAFAATLELVAMANIVLIALAVPISNRGTRASNVEAQAVSRESQAPRPDRFGWLAAAVATVIAATLNVTSYERHPHVPDEVNYLIHARYFADGMWTMPAPTVPAAFDLDLMTYEPTQWYSPVPPGWPAVLAVGAFFGMPWLVNPVLAGLSVRLAYALFLHWYTRRTARYAAALLACSPWFLFLGMSYMTHMFTLTCALVAAVGVAKARESGSWLWGLIGGVGVGATSLIRPLDGLLVGILIAMWALGLGGRRLRLAALAGLFAGTVGAGALQFPYNRMLTGDPLQFPINAYTDAHYGRNSNAYGFGPDRGLGWAIDPNPGHGPVDGVINANLNAFGINTDLFGWSTGSLFLVALFLCAGTLSRSDRALMAAVVVISGGYFFYYFSGGPDFAARYWFPVVIPLVALSARGLEWLEARAGARAPVAIAALVIMALTTFVPWRALDKYRHFRGMRGDVPALARTHGFERDLIFVRGARHPDYASAAIQNPVDLQAAVPIYAWEKNPEVRAATIRAYPDRRVWFVDGPSVTGAGYRVAAGPLASAEAVGRSP